MTTIYPVIMCGGSGNRLWPLSTKDKPKQFHSIVTQNSMLQETIIRARNVGGLNLAAPSFVCAASHENLIRNQCKSVGIEPLSIILEPCARNTAPVAAAIALEISRIDPKGLVLLLPADQHIERPADFWAAIGKGIAAANLGRITTFGILPTHAETGYGYIQAGRRLSEKCVEVKAFVEKPTKKSAEKYLKSGEYFWNGGIFLFSPEAMILAFKNYARDILDNVTDAIVVSKRFGSSLYLDPVTFTKCRSESVDYAIMEKLKNIAMVCPVDIGWSDIGSWEAIRNYLTDDEGNVPTRGPVISLDCENSLITTDGTFVAAIGLKDIIVVVTECSVLVAHSSQTQNVKKIVQELKASKKTDLL